MVGRVNSPVPNPTGLPPFVENNKDWLIVIPIRIAITIIVAVIVRWLLHRLIDRLVRPVRGGVPRILRPFKERIESSRLIESTGLLSERRGQRAQTIGSVIKSIISIIILSIAVMVILSELQVDLAPFIAGTSIVGVALGFGAQNIVKDFLSGMFMMLEDQYGVGDGTVWYVRNGEVLRVGNKSQGYAQVVLDVPIDASADVAEASGAILDEAEQMRAEEEWGGVFLGDPDMQGVESMTREETVLRLVARVRPGEQFRTARELRRRVRARLDRLDIGAHEPEARTPSPSEEA